MPEPTRPLSADDVLGIIETIYVEHVGGLDEADLLALRDLALAALRIRAILEALPATSNATPLQSED